MVWPLCCLFNEILEEGLPPFLTMVFIHPIHKEEDPSDPVNYRELRVKWLGFPPAVAKVGQVRVC